MKLATRMQCPAHWEPESPTVLRDQIAAYDDMRHRCPIAHSDSMHWSVFRHADVLRALQQPRTFSNEVSAHLAVPNGMDPPRHTAYRRLIDRYFSRARIESFEPRCRALAVRRLQELPKDRAVEVMGELARTYAFEAQCAFLGWSTDLDGPLRQWMIRNHDATQARDSAASAAVALEFDGYIREMLAERRRLPQLAGDVTSQLLRERIGERLLTDEEIVSILRNWTVGELATIAASVGILVYYLATHTHVQEQLRRVPELLPVAIDEILRIHPPLIASRRKALRPVNIGGAAMTPGVRLTLMWASANRDESVFGDPDEFRLDRDPRDNLLYGAGIHACPGAPLARVELGVLLEELLARTKQISLHADRHPVAATYPTAGYAQAWVILR